MGSLCDGVGGFYWLFMRRLMVGHMRFLMMLDYQGIMYL